MRTTKKPNICQCPGLGHDRFLGNHARLKAEIGRLIEKLPEYLLPQLHDFLLFLIWRKSQNKPPVSLDSKEILQELLQKRRENYLQNPETPRPAEEVVSEAIKKTATGSIKC